jgi:hypothetical protein
MLSQYDRQQLELISSHLHIDDPDLAKSLRDGTPRPDRTAPRWPLAVLAVLAGLLFTAGAVIMSVGFMFLGAVALWAISWVDRRMTGRQSRFAPLWAKLVNRR